MTPIQYLILIVAMLLVGFIAHKIQNAIEKKQAERIEEFEVYQAPEHTISIAPAAEDPESEDTYVPDMAPLTSVSEEEAEEIQEKLMEDVHNTPKKPRNYKKSQKREQGPSSAVEKPKKRKPRKNTEKKNS